MAQRAGDGVGTRPSRDHADDLGAAVVVSGLTRRCRLSGTAGSGAAGPKRLAVLVSILLLAVVALPPRVAAAGSTSADWDGTYGVGEVSVTCPAPDAGTTPSAEGAIPSRVTVTNNAISGRPISASGQAPYAYSRGDSGVGYTIAVSSAGTYSFSATRAGGASFVAHGIITVASSTQNHFAGGSSALVVCTASFVGIRGGSPALTRSSGSSFPSAMVGGGLALLLAELILLALALTVLRRAPQATPSPTDAAPAAFSPAATAAPAGAGGALRDPGYLWKHGDVIGLAQPSPTRMRAHLRARVKLLPLLLVGATAFGLSLLLPWHQRFAYATHTYVTVRGMDAETWVIAGCVFALALGYLFLRRRPGLAAKLLAVCAGGVMVACLAIDYLDWQMSAAAVNSNVAALMYLGPGFYLALGGTMLLIATTVLVWRHL